MTDTTNPRARLDKALFVMRLAEKLTTDERITQAATIACAEALSLLVDAHLPTPAPERGPDPREGLPDDTLVDHGWVMDDCGGRDLFKRESDGFFTRWTVDKWEPPGRWEESEMFEPRPATVGDLRRAGVPVTEWPEITAPEPGPSRAEKAEPEEPPVGSVVLDCDGDAWLRNDEGWSSANDASFGWDDLHQYGPLTVIHRAEP